MKAISLFSGVGGMDLGFERAGIETVLQVEIDPFCRQVLEKHWPNVRRIADVADVTAEDVRGVDLVYGGFPCQPVSLAGLRKAQDDERWLWPEFYRVLRLSRPRYVVVENVPGLLTAGIDDVLRDLSTLGFDADWSFVPACAMGAPHTRERVFILAHTTGERWSEVVRDFNGASIEAPREWPSEDARSSMRAADWMEQAASVYEPPILSSRDGIPHIVDELRAYGNAVVPQVAEWIGHRLMAVDRIAA